MNACFINDTFGLIFLSLITSSTSQWCTETNRSPGPAIMNDFDWMPPIVVCLPFKRVTPPCLYHECKITFPAAHAADHEAHTINKIHDVMPNPLSGIEPPSTPETRNCASYLYPPSTTPKCQPVASDRQGQTADGEITRPGAE